MATNSSPKRSRGERRREAILEAATSLFLERGFEGASLDEVIRRAGGSRSTVYEEFGGKEGLFAAIITGYCETTLVPLARADADSPPDRVLEGFGLAFMELLMQPASIALYRAVIAESRRFPALGLQVFHSGPLPAATRLADYLRQQTRRGRLKVGDPELAARHFLEMIKGDLHTRALFGIAPPPAAGEIRRCVRQGVRTFLGGLAAA